MSSIVAIALHALAAATSAEPGVAMVAAVTLVCETPLPHAVMSSYALNGSIARVARFPHGVPSRNDAALNHKQPSRSTRDRGPTAGATWRA
jgi:hypothetical protein